MSGNDLIGRLLELSNEVAPTRVAGEATGPPPDSLDAAREQISNLTVALHRRTVIGQATGIVMERFGLDAEVALSVLRRLSQEKNRRLHDIAVELVASGHAEEL